VEVGDPAEETPGHPDAQHLTTTGTERYLGNSSDGFNPRPAFSGCCCAALSSGNILRALGGPSIAQSGSNAQAFSAPRRPSLVRLESGQRMDRDRESQESQDKRLAGFLSLI
jgi:hypothetical protein